MGTALGKEIGIDLGTTTTIVSYTGKKNGKLKQLKYEGDKLIPSVLYFHSKSEWDIGTTAISGMELHPLAGVANFKSHLADSEYRYEVTAENGDHFYLKPRKAAEMFLRKVIVGMETQLLKEFGALGGTIERAVITVPAKFSLAAKDVTKRVAKDCGLDAKLTKEPTAAATYYLHSYNEFDRPGAVILVYDFGGGTFDVSVVQRQQDSFKEIATGGDNALGGNLLTERIVAYLIERIEEYYAVSFPEEADDLEGEELKAYQENMVEIRRKANIMKEDLSDVSEAERDLYLLIDGKQQTFEAFLSREEFEDLIRADIDRTVTIVQHTLQKAAAKGIDHIDTVVMAGGSSNVPLARKALQEQLPHLAIDPATNATFLISCGAALLAERVEKLDEIALITNTQIGTKAKEGLVFNKFQMLIAENTPLPASGSQTFVLDRDDQREYKIAYYEYDVDNHPGMTRTDQDGMEEVEVLTVALPPGLKKNDTEIEVCFDMQSDGSLEITAVTKDKTGTVISDNNLQIKRESDWE
ncbi:MAG: Hsp70 family protein [bacterium]|nr:Hsp70 family protein [bacterium]